MEKKLNFWGFAFAFLISISIHAYVLLFYKNFSFKFIKEQKNKITINLSPIGNIKDDSIKETIKKEEIIQKKVPEIKKLKKEKEKFEKKLDIKKIIPQKKSIEQKKNIKEDTSGTSKGIEGGVSKTIISEYVTQIYKLIDAKKKYPRQSLIRREEGAVLLQIIIRKDGKLISVKSLKAKHQRLVDSSFDAVEDAAPFPEFPKQIKKEKMIMEIPVIYKIR
jgi:TonB family protein